MKNLKSKLKSDPIKAIAWVASMEYRNEKIGLCLDIDEAATPYVKSIEKDYSLLEKIHIEGCKYIFSVSLNDYGWDFGDSELIKETSGHYGSELNYEVSNVDSEECEITLKGHIFTEIMSASYSPPVADIAYYALDDDIYKSLEIHEVLALEAFHLAERRDYKLSLFTYFTAIESLVSSLIDEYREKVHEELHYSLEHLDLDKKLRIVVKEKTKISDFKSIPIWGSFTEAFTAAKRVRNGIAHAKSVKEITDTELFNAFYALVVLKALLFHDCSSFNDIRKIIYPKT